MPRADLIIEAAIEPRGMRVPLTISGYVFDQLEFLTVTVSDGVSSGRGEAAGVYYRDDTPAKMLREIRHVRDRVSRGVSRHELLDLLPPGGARNALDCALWEFESKQLGMPIWQLAGLSPPRPLITTMTLGAGAPEDMAAQAVSAFPRARALKLKLLGDGRDAERVAAVRGARGDVWLGVDANQGFTRETLSEALPHFIAANVAVIEQPLKAGAIVSGDRLDCPIAIAADEDVQSIDDLDALVGRIQVINIKLDKCGGLTAALAMSAQAKSLGFQVMVGSMPGTSLAMAPAFLVGQACDIVDLDAPLFLSDDRQPSMIYFEGKIDMPPGLWGASGVRD